MGCVSSGESVCLSEPGSLGAHCVPPPPGARGSLALAGLALGAAGVLCSPASWLHSPRATPCGSSHHPGWGYMPRPGRLGEVADPSWGMDTDQAVGTPQE